VGRGLAHAREYTPPFRHRLVSAGA
jgi:hypothetical protein